jgi:hypothetical protein
LSDDASTKKDPTAIPSAQFSYIKSNFFRVIHVDGAVAGAGPTGVFLSLYSERLPIPQQQVFEINVEAETLGSEIVDRRVARTGIVRELEAGVVMTVEAAEAVAQLLLRQAENIKNAKSEMKKK